MFINNVLILLLFLSFNTWVNATESLLTLEQALKIGKHTLASKQQLLQIKEKQLDLKTIQNNFDIQAKLDLQLAKRKEYADSTNNSHTFIHLEKTLFEQDQSIQIIHKKEEIAQEKNKLRIIQQEKNIHIMRHFFNVILADMQLETIMEKLAISAIRSSRVQDDYDINHASEVDLLEKRYIVEINLSEKIKLENKQIITRAILADILNLSYENRPDNLLRPKLDKYFLIEIKDFDLLRKNVLSSNLELKNKQVELMSIQNKILNEKNNYQITIKANARLGEQSYFREKNGNWRAGINLTMPLFNTNKLNNIDKLKVKIKKQELDIQQFKQNLLQQLSTLWNNFKTLKAMHKSLVTELDYRDLALERARANYEMELKSDIGNSMTKLTETEWRLANNEFNFVIVVEKLRLIGAIK